MFLFFGLTSFYFLPLQVKQELRKIVIAKQERSRKNRVSN